MLPDDNDDQYRRSKYQKIYLPKIIEVKLSELKGFTHIKTIDAGRMTGHIIKDNATKEYTMCLSQTDTIKVDEAVYRPLGYTRFNIEELEKLAQSFIKVYKNKSRISTSLRIYRKDLKKVVHPPVIDITKNWSIRMAGHKLINTKTKQEVDLGMAKLQVSKTIGLKGTFVDTMILTGLEIRDWCYKGKRIDGRTWEEYFSGAKPKEQIYDTVNFLKFVKGSKVINYVNLRHTAEELGTHNKKLAYVLRSNKDEICGYKIIRGCQKVLRVD